VPRWTRRYEAYARPLLAREDVVGLALAVAQGGRPVYVRGFGERDRGRGLPVTERTLFGIASLTKAFTAVAVLQLQERGRLRVDEPVRRLVPELRLPHVDGPRPMRIEHLLTHTAGLPPLPTVRAALARSVRADPSVAVRVRAGLPPPIDTWDDLLRFLAALRVEPLAAPGERFSYSNDGYALLGLVVERASGERYEDYVTRHILGPAAMVDTTFDLAQVLAGRDTARLYCAERRGDGSAQARDAGAWWEAGPMAAAGFLRSNARDMLRFLELFRTAGRVGERRLLAPDSVGEMLRPRARCAADTWYGYGVMVGRESDGARVVEHSGHLKGAAAWMAALPERGLTAVALSNLSGAPTARIGRGAINVALGREPGAPRTRWPRDYRPSAPLGDYEGVYTSDEGECVEVRCAGGSLIARVDGDDHVLRAVADDLFLLSEDGDEREVGFLRDGRGSVDAIVFRYRVVRKRAEVAAVVAAAAARA
jgi:CubicO group peptidase (beta-lactamase class C family)